MSSVSDCSSLVLLEGSALFFEDLLVLRDQVVTVDRGVDGAKQNREIILLYSHVLTS